MTSTQWDQGRAYSQYNASAIIQMSEGDSVFLPSFLELPGMMTLGGHGGWIRWVGLGRGFPNGWGYGEGVRRVRGNAWVG